MASTADPAAAQDPRDRVLAALTADLDSGFTELFAAYRRVVFSTALRLCGRFADAEDLAAETFLRAYRALCGYDHDRTAALQPRPWLLTILLNLWRNSLRTAARQPDLVAEVPEIADPGEGVEQAVQRRETGRELAGLLAVLPPEQRAAVVLRHVSGLPVTEIAAILHRPEGTVKSHISRGLRRLRQLQSVDYPAPKEDAR
jgi:RNA polymerase sigma factor (sigma-70 family)